MTKPPAANYLPQLDGLRFFAFLLVFIHHSNAAATVPLLNAVKDKGWGGVDVFFAISGFLLFTLLRREQEQTGRISIAKFYTRRALTILPLLWLFAIAMFVLFSNHDRGALLRTAGVMFGFDNLLVSVGGYTVNPMFTGHLWSLSFELQVYALIPALFLAYRHLGQRRFLAVLLGIAIYCAGVRTAMVLLGGFWQFVWVSPLLRPESVLLGIALAVYRPTWPPVLSLLGAIGLGWVLLVHHQIDTQNGTLFNYPIVALFAGCLIDTALRLQPAGRILGSPPIRSLGRISYGLYVFHILAIDRVPLYVGLDPATILIASFVLTVVLAAMTQLAIEFVLAKLKRRVTVVEGRALPGLGTQIGAESSPLQPLPTASAEGK